MIEVKIGDNVKRETIHVSEDATLRETLNNNNISYANATTNLDGCPLDPGDLNKTFREFGFDGTPGHDFCYLLCVVKADNA